MTDYDPIRPDYNDPQKHPFMGPSPGLVSQGASPDECGECGQDRSKHIPTLGEIHGILKALRDRGASYESVFWVMDNQTWWDRHP